MKGRNWFAAAAAASVALFLWWRRPPCEEPVEPEVAPVIEEPRALPSSVVAEDESVGQGQALLVAALATAALLGALLGLTFIIPPAFVAAGMAFGPLLLGAFTVGVIHIRANGIRSGDPP